jgi:beta-galactosidase
MDADMPGRSADVTRREALRYGAVAAGSLTAARAVRQSPAMAATAPATAVTATAAGRSERSFDEGWLFYRGDVSGGEAVSLDDGSWQVLDLPHDWSIEDLPYATSQDTEATAYPSTLVYQSGGPVQPPPPPVIGPFDAQNSAGGRATGYTVGGVGWYRKHFTVSGLSGDHRAELRFDGVYQNADVWLNGTHLGFHPYGYTPFGFDLTPYLDRAGTNVLAVRVDNSGKTSRWYSGSGIYRHTWLTVTGPVRIPLWGIYVTTPRVSEQESVAHVEVPVANQGRRHVSALVRVTLLEPRGDVVATGTGEARSIAPGGQASVSLDLRVRDAALWSPDTPDLYTARAEILVGGTAVDTAETAFGIRSLEWSGTDGFLLNGTRVALHGAGVHDTHGPLGAAGLDRSAERRIEILKAAGFNAIRTAHNPPAPALLDACDRLGMLVWDEFTDVWDTGKNPQDYSVYFARWWQHDLTTMIMRDRNHPSVIIWSLGNEIVKDSRYAERGAQLAAVVRSLDATRAVTLSGGATSGPDDPSWRYVDVGDVHYNADGDGYAAIRAAHPDTAVTQSESFGATIYDDAVHMAENPWLAGTWVWAGWDYLGDSGLGKTPVAPAGTWHTIYDQTTEPGWSAGQALYLSYDGYGYGYPWFQSNCGDIDLIGQRKPQSYWRAAVTGASPVEMMVARPSPAGSEQEACRWGYYDELPNWTWEAVATGTPMTVHVYTPGDSVTLLLSGSVVGTAVPDKAKATFTVPYTPGGELTAIASLGGQVIGSKTIPTVVAPAAIRLTCDVAALTTSRDALAHVLAELVDGTGTVVPHAMGQMTFTVSGAGELAGVANGNSHNVHSFRQPHLNVWHGQALAILRPAKTPGTLTVSATVNEQGETLPGASLTLDVLPA